MESVGFNRGESIGFHSVHSPHLMQEFPRHQLSLHKFMKNYKKFNQENKHLNNGEKLGKLETRSLYSYHSITDLFSVYPFTIFFRISGQEKSMRPVLPDVLLFYPVLR